MNVMMIVGIVLIVLGAAGLVFQGISYTTRETIVDVPGVKISTDVQKTVSVPLVVSGLALAAGIVVVIAGARRP